MRRTRRAGGRRYTVDGSDGSENDFIPTNILNTLMLMKYESKLSINVTTTLGPLHTIYTVSLVEKR